MNNDILVVDNTEGISEILNISLATEFNAVTVENGNKALNLLSEKYFPILICDIDIPDMDGIEFLCRVKKQNPHTEVIMIAGQKNADIGVKSLKYEASDFIIKPVTSSSLEIVLERARKKIVINKKLTIPSDTDIIVDKTYCIKQLIDIFESTGYQSAVVLLDKKSNILYASKKFIELFGELSENDFTSLDKNCKERHYQVLSSSNTVHEKILIQTIRGDKYHCEITSSPIKNSGTVVDFILETLSEAT